MVRSQACAIFVIVLIAALLPSTNCRADPPSSPGELLEIAELKDIFFVDPDCGWAVGDHGVIWRTRNGGRDWQLVDSPSTCRFESVHFIDENHGWIVGGWIHPLTYKSSAVVLYTEDGGARWTRLEQPMLPSLKWVWFANRRQGWALGNASTLYASGMVRTEDGGRTWTSWPAPDSRSMVAGAITGREQLIALDRDSIPWALSGSDLRPIGKPDLGRRQLAALAADGAQAWAVGDGGAILTSSDGGGSWDVPRGALPAGIASQFDWRCVAVRGPHCWIAGVPGTSVLHSADHGATWQLYGTRYSAPLTAIHFIDERQGWAAGALGCILTTRDGGRSWRMQRQGATRAGLVGAFSSVETVPWELMASVAADEGHSAVVQLATKPRDTPLDETTIAERASQAASAVGANSDLTAWRFPVSGTSNAPADEWITSGWDRESSPSPTERYEEYLVRQIRMWRPDVLVCEPLSPDGKSPLPHLVSQIAMRAAERAGDPTVYADQIVQAKLEPWSVKKVLSVLPPGQRGGISIDHEKLAIHLGCSLADYSALSRGLASPTDDLSPSTTELRSIGGTMNQESGRRDIFGGIQLGEVGESRRASVASVGVNLDSLARVLQKRRETQQMILEAANQRNAASTLVSQVDRLIAGFSPHYAGVILHRLAQECLAKGDVQGCAKIRIALIDRYPNHLFADALLLKLLDFYASRECQIAFHSTPGSADGRSIPVRLPPAEPGDNRSNPQTAETIRSATFVRTSSDPSTLAIPPGEESIAMQFFDRLKSQNPALFYEPAIQLRLAALYRRTGESAESARILNALVNSTLPFAHRSNARAEQWLSTRSGKSPRPVLTCSPTMERPYLDGNLDEPLWDGAGYTVLKGTRSEPDAADVRIACDELFLYVGLRCIKLPSADYSPAQSARGRDADLSQSDHVELTLDIDRDYSTAFRLAIDYRGRTTESCCDNKSWNPRWHVATSSTDQDWTAEIAIPLAELDPKPDNLREGWGIAVQRRCQGRLVASWTDFDAVGSEPPAWGLLLFH